MLRTGFAVAVSSLAVWVAATPRPTTDTRDAGAAMPPAVEPRPAPQFAGRLKPTLGAPPLLRRSAFPRKPATVHGKGSLAYKAEGPSTVRPGSVKRAAGPAAGLKAAADRPVRGGNRIESLFSDAQVAQAIAQAQQRKADPGAQGVKSWSGHHSFDFLQGGPRLLDSWDAIDAGDCCEGTGYSATVPPDPDLAVGPDHIIAVVNTAFEIYDKQGNVLVPAVQFSSFFDGTPGCTAFVMYPGYGLVGATFDPDVVYDEKNDRFVIGIDGNGTDYCVAATKTGDPTGEWRRYGFATNVNDAFFDFPHMGIGEDAVFVGSNQFYGDLLYGFEGRVFAVNKRDLYRGRPLRVVTREVKPEGQPTLRLDGTPQPAQLQGDRQWWWPKSEGHYIMTEYFDGKVHSVYAWEDPFGEDEFDLVGDVDLAEASGVPCEGFSCFPVPWPQAGSVEILQANDYRGQETKYRNGHLWTAQTISCNPGGGTVNCIRWAQIDPRRVKPGVLDLATGVLDASTKGVRQAGVFSSEGEHRTFPSLAVNHCDDMAVGYSVGSSSTFPSIAVSGRRFFDQRGTVRDEVALKEGEVPYTSFQDDGGASPERWGDYSGMAIDPNGRTFWYIGEYSRDNSVANEFAGWGTYIGKFEFKCFSPHW